MLVYINRHWILHNRVPTYNIINYNVFNDIFIIYDLRAFIQSVNSGGEGAYNIKYNDCLSSNINVINIIL